MSEINDKSISKKKVDYTKLPDGSIVDPKEIEIALKNGFSDISEWLDAKEKGIGNYPTYQYWLELSKKNVPIEGFKLMLKGNFTDYDQYLQAHNEGFDSKIDWEDWQEIKNSGFTDIDLFNESKSVAFIQNSIRKNFLKDFKLAIKGGFKSYREWNEAKKWGIRTFGEWDYIKGLGFSSEEEYNLFKEFRIKILSSDQELNQTKENLRENLKIGIIKEFNYDINDNNFKTYVYKDFTRQRFEEILELAITEMIISSTKLGSVDFGSNNLIFKESLSEESQAQSISSTIICPNCRKRTAKRNAFCSECGEKIEKCSICETSLFSDKNAICPHCKSKFHHRHLKEFVKVSGTCPICKNELKEVDFL